MFSHSIIPLIILITYSGTGQSLENGDELVDDNFKYHVYVKNALWHSCSGAIIHERHILTAAHCVYRNSPDQLTVLAGSTSLSPECLNAYDVKRIHIHGDYAVNYYSVWDMTMDFWPLRRANDIAVLTLRYALQFAENIGSVGLPRKPMMPCSPAECVVTGWGIVHQPESQDYVHLLWAKAEIMPSLYCEIFEAPIGTNELCLTDVRDVVKVHHLDTGGGIVCDGVLVGIMTTIGLPIAAVDVYSHSSFINEILLIHP